MQKIFDTYHLDPLYYHLNLLFEFLKAEYYNHYGLFREVEKNFEEVNDAVATLVVNYPTYTFSSHFLITKLNRHFRLGTEKDMAAENESLFSDIEPDLQDVPHHTVYTTYKALGLYYAQRFSDSVKMLTGMLTDVNLKKYPLVLLELKGILTLQYYLLKDFELFNQQYSSVQRQVRAQGEENCQNITQFLKILMTAKTEVKTNKAKKITSAVKIFKGEKVSYFAPTHLIKMDNKFIEDLSAIVVPR